ncbi:riboflavin synthase subunit alpha [Corynebacterium xerosis]|uniref:riboflavin synthase n=1 Tax=Corynebacterium xerosis TaxID=1725 RepID=UPI00062828BE|nr:riboflavin synthase [Corynebacterium xerosis]KKO81565.1 riboflavin synthase subunit alpha [Corynebacterium xerosis]SQB95123.1 riboflavin synthase subunit alpha [Clostridium paraputrificum]
MFTGIVEELGRVAAIEDQGDAIRLGIGCELAVSDAKLGDSIAVNGVCLTVAEFDDEGFTADVMQESLDRTSLGGLAVGSPVNLERAVAAGARLGGHIVQGHVDGTGAIVSRMPGEHWEVVRISLPDELDRYVVEKGSIAVDGTSLTVSAVGGDDGARWFEVSLIPTTLADTVLGTLDAGATVNLEVDVVAKYIEKLLPR